MAGIDEGVLEFGISLDKLLAEERGVRNIGEEADEEGIFGRKMS